MLTFNEILNNGFDGHHFITGLSSHLRDLLVSRNAETVQLLEVGGEIKQHYKEQARVAEAAFLLDALQISNECDMQYKQTMNKRLLVELALVRIAQLTLKKK
jgi:DNA polymerase-3 subunit gamma/tau